MSPQKYDDVYMQVLEALKRNADMPFIHEYSEPPNIEFKRKTSQTIKALITKRYDNSKTCSLLKRRLDKINAGLRNPHSATTGDKLRARRRNVNDEIRNNNC